MAGTAHQAWDVYLHGKWMTTVFFTPDMTADDVKRALVGHDGYDTNIVVRRDTRYNGYKAEG